MTELDTQITLEIQQEQLDYLIKSMDDVMERFAELDDVIQHASIDASKMRIIKPEELPVYDGT